eukprot:Partr_v1_DN28523_c1_g1_i1_m73832 putative Son of sevenless homolog
MDTTTTKYPSIDGLILLPDARVHIKHIYGVDTELNIELPGSFKQTVLLAGDGSAVLKEKTAYTTSTQSRTTSANNLTASKLRKVAQFTKSRRQDGEMAKEASAAGFMANIGSNIGTIARRNRSQSSASLAEIMKPLSSSTSATMKSKSDIKSSKPSSTLEDGIFANIMPDKSSWTGTIRGLKKKKGGVDSSNSQKAINQPLIVEPVDSEPGQPGKLRSSHSFNSGFVSRTSITRNRNAVIQDIDEDNQDESPVFSSEFAHDSDLGVDKSSRITTSYSVNSIALNGNILVTASSLEDREASTDKPADDASLATYDDQSMFSYKVSSTSGKFPLETVLDETRRTRINTSSYPVFAKFSGALRFASGDNADMGDPFQFVLERYRLTGYIDENCNENDDVFQAEIPGAIAEIAPYNPLIFRLSHGAEAMTDFLCGSVEETYEWVARINTKCLTAIYYRSLETAASDTSKLIDSAAQYRHELQSLTTSLKQSIDKKRGARSDSDEEIQTAMTSVQKLQLLAKEQNRSLSRLGVHDMSKSSSSLSNSKHEKLEERLRKWDLNLSDNGKLVEKSGSYVCTLQTLVDKLICQDYAPDGEFINLFFNTYRHVSKPREVLDSLVKKYICMPEVDGGEAHNSQMSKWSANVRVRVLFVLRRWIDDFWIDFVMSDILEDCTLFLDAIIDMKVAPASYGDLSKVENDKFIKIDLKKLAGQVKDLLEINSTLYKSDFARSISSTSDDSQKKAGFELHHIDSDIELAAELTRRDLKRYQDIRPIEFFLHVWDNKDKPEVKHEIRHLARAVDAFNKTSYWAATEICTQPELKNRIKVLERMIVIANEFRTHRNFNSLLALISGLNVAAVTRLKATWEGISPKSQKIYSELEEMVSPQNNFSKYREIIAQLEVECVDGMSSKSGSTESSPISSPIMTQTLSTSGNVISPALARIRDARQSASTREKDREQATEPAIPIISLFLKDLLFLSDGNPKRIEELGMINYSKLKSLHVAVQRILLFQNTQYDMPPVSDKVKNYCDNMRALKETALYKYSTLAEARAGEQNQTRLVDKWMKENV